MDLEVVRIGLEVIDRILPVGGEDVPRWTGEALIYLQTVGQRGQGGAVSKENEPHICPQALV